MDFKKILLYGGGLLLATTGPISLFSTSDLVANIRKSTATSSTAQAAPASGTAASAADPLPATLAPAVASPEMTLRPPTLAEALNFDVTVDWVMRRWPRVSTGLSQVQLQGYRVPLVTGTATADVAGSLTYYFTPQQKVQQITLRGTTGDPSALIAFLTGRYHFARRATNDPAVLLFETVDSSNRPAGTAKIRSASVIKANQPYNRFEIELSIDRPE